MIFKELPMQLAFILVLSGIASASLAAWVAACRRKVNGAFEFSLFLLSVSFYSFGYALEINQNTLPGIFDSLRIQFLGIPFSAVLFFVFTVKLVTGRKIKYYFLCLLFAIPVITMLLVLNLENHDLFYKTTSLDFDRIFPMLEYSVGPWYVINMLSLVLSSSAAEILLLINIIKKEGVERKQYLFVFVSGLLPIISAVINPARVHNIDLQPFFLTITGILLAVALFRYRMFDIVPYAREIAVDSIREILVVFDTYGIVQDINLSAKKSDIPGEIMIGSSLPETSPLRRFADSAVQYSEPSQENLEYQFEYNNKNYLLKITYISKGNKSGRGFVFIISDITKSVMLIRELEYFAIYDSLTGIFNRRHILDLAQTEIDKARRSSVDLGFVLIDIDYFKKINDVYGHLAGDYVLKKIASVLSDELRVTDLFGRYGGEEFLIICPGSDAETTLSISERLRKAVEKYEFVYNDEIIKINASFGIYALIPSDGDKIDEILHKADIALYLAKNHGRNKCEVYQ